MVQSLLVQIEIVSWKTVAELKKNFQSRSPFWYQFTMIFFQMFHYSEEEL